MTLHKNDQIQGLQTVLAYGQQCGGSLSLHVWVFVQRIENRISESYLHSQVHSSIIHITAKMWKQPTYPPIDEWIKKCGLRIQQNIIYPCEGRKSVHGRKKHVITWMNHEDVILSKINQSQKDKCYVNSFK